MLDEKMTLECSHGSDEFYSIILDTTRVVNPETSLYKTGSQNESLWIFLLPYPLLPLFSFPTYSCLLKIPSASRRPNYCLAFWKKNSFPCARGKPEFVEWIETWRKPYREPHNRTREFIERYGKRKIQCCTNETRTRKNVEAEKCTRIIRYFFN